MKSEIFTVKHDDGEFQRFQVVSDFEWQDVNYFSPGIEPKSVSELVRLYEVNIIPKLRVHEGSFVFFCIPEGMTVPFERETGIGYVYDNNILFKYVLEKAWESGKLSFDGPHRIVSSDPQIADILDKLESMKLIGVASDEKAEGLIVHPVNDKLGFVSSKKAAVTVNSHFFLMDPTDMDSPYCRIATPHGLVLQKGHVLNPPLNHRTMLLVDWDNKTELRHLELSELSFLIEGREYVPGKNCTVHFRPDERVTPKHDGTDLVITEEKVVAHNLGGETVIPVAGFVLSIPSRIMKLQHTSVVYRGMENWRFGAQVGPEMMVEGKMVDHDIFPFFRLGEDPVAYAPTVYPLPFETARASRICLGTDKNGKPVVIWAEGRGKLGIDKDKDSTGASLLEMAEFCRSQEYCNIINLDGGGSASMTFRHKRYLKIADRMPVSNRECERPVPNGLYIV